MKIFGIYISRTPPADVAQGQIQELNSALQEERKHRQAINDELAKKKAQLKMDEAIAAKKREKAKRAAEMEKLRLAIAHLESAERYQNMLNTDLPESRTLEYRRLIMERIEKVQGMGISVNEQTINKKLNALRQVVHGN